MFKNFGRSLSSLNPQAGQMMGQVSSLGGMAAQNMGRIAGGVSNYASPMLSAMGMGGALGRALGGRRRSINYVTDWSLPPQSAQDERFNQIKIDKYQTGETKQDPMFDAVRRLRVQSKGMGRF
jgi:hypothetical protein